MRNFFVIAALIVAAAVCMVASVELAGADDFSDPSSMSNPTNIYSPANPLNPLWQDPGTSDSEPVHDVKGNWEIKLGAVGVALIIVGGTFGFIHWDQRRKSKHKG